MKPAGFLLFIPAGFVAVLTAEETSAGLTSRETKARIREGLPSYRPPPPQAEGAPATERAASTDADLLILPKMTVKKVRLPPDADDYLMSKRDLDRKMANLYLDSLAEVGPLNVLLNSVTIPILSPSKAERGRAVYRSRELDRLRHVTNAAKALDPGADKKLERELDNTWTTRPAGELQR